MSDRTAYRITGWLAAFLLGVTVLNVFGNWFSWKDLGQRALDNARPKEAVALAQYTPTGGTMVVGTTASPITSGAIAGNVGSWKGTLASDNMRWSASSTASGLNQQLQFDNAQLNNGNKMIITLEPTTNVATLNRLYQICDWSSAASVDNAADAQCTGGGWRTLNIRDVGVTSVTEALYVWHIYDGYWNTTTNANIAVSTPLSNFIRSSDDRILIRAYSATNCTTCVHSIDYARVDSVIDPVYMPSGLTTSTVSTVTGDYRNTTNALFSSQSASDNTYLQVAGTVSTVADFYLPFKNVRTYTGANTILVRAEYSCSNTGLNHRPKIYNFDTASWEDLTPTSIACSATDTTSAFAKNNITMSDYVSGGEIRIGWRGLSNSVVALRIDQIYLMIGSTNSDSSLCEISFGTGTATDCVNTRTLDTTAALSTWQQTTEAESTTFGHDFYALDNDADATSAEHAASSNLYLPVTVDNPARVTGLAFATNWRSNATTITTQNQFKDNSGTNATVSGGWTAFGATNAATTYTYQDSVTGGYFLSNTEDYLDTVNGQINIRTRTTASTAATGVTRDIDFIFASVQWVEPSPARYTLNYRELADSGSMVVGTTASPITAGATSGNVGSWKGLLASDNFRWTASSTASGLDQQVILNDVQLNEANKMIVVMEATTNNTTLNRLYQICDWSSTASVDNAADAQCTGGGWRTLNIRDVGITATAETSYTWHIYDGYWNTTTNANIAVSTPLSNFVRTSDARVLLRAYSATNCTTCTHSLDFVRVDSVIDPVYSPAGLVTSSVGTVTGDYRNVTNALFTGQPGSDNSFLQVAGNATTAADFYLPFKNVRTYTGANTILVRAEYSCGATGINHRPKIYNFTTASWEDLTSTSIACSTTEATGAFAKNNVTITDYISNDEIRIGWRGLAAGTQAIRLDQIYLMIGSTNSDSSLCEISFGTGTATDCVNTRTLDTTAALSTWQQTTEAESTTFGHDFYALDNDADATSAEHAASSNLWMTTLIPASAQLTARGYATNWRSNATTITAQPQFRDFSGGNVTVSGGWTLFGAANALTTYTYSDNVTNGYYSNNAEDYVDPISGLVNVRIRTSASTAVAAVTRDIDFVMTTVQWVQPAGATPTIALSVSSSSVALGALAPGIPLTASTTAEVTASALSSGYQVSVERASSTATLTHTDAITLMPDALAWNNAGSGNGTASPGSTVAFRVSASTANFDSTWWGSGTPLYAGFPTSSIGIMNCTACTSGMTSTTITYRVDAPVDQKTGAYTGSVTYTALANP